ncbi:hypothetical protein EXIGLDRAFT_720662 [Exidia glandulosa HHB12029]|uniref:Monopolin complex subunit Csm1/Pcs1 C-terminal domain-containing protein n=1 Tax=Exidia glandulosa HHB12029 TaxID=1314781 RepID=A0A165G7D0_EXIGL|nr:hypothetical protein EXIGLDRAFT_720662 [Exidia glandulosa HHB12029]
MAAKRKKGHPHEHDSEHEVVSVSDGNTEVHIVADDSDDSVRAQTPPQPSTSKSRAPPLKKPATSSGSGPSRHNGKGKGRADELPEAMVVDHDEDVAPLPARPTASVRELERIRKLKQKAEAQAADLEDQVQVLQKQFDDLTKLRTTDAERSRDDQRIEFEARIQTQEQLIKELTSQLARATKAAANKLPVTGKALSSSIPHFITREAAQEERRAVERELAKRAEEVKEREQRIQERDDQITELKTAVRIAEEELRYERQQKATYTPASSSKAMRGGAGMRVEAGHQERLVRFYEDITNVLVTSIRAGPPVGGVGSEGEWTYNCCISMGPGGIDLSFKLTTFAPANGVKSEDQPWVYTPVNLERERPQVRLEVLDFFGESFQFPKKQLPAFFKQLSEKIAPDAAPAGDDDDDD